MVLNNKILINFYYPHPVDIGAIPESEDSYVIRRPGNYVWTVKTYALLQASGFACTLTSTMPEEGIIITHRNFLPDHLAPNSKQLFVCIVSDTHRHPYAQVHLLQNQCDSLIRRPSNLWTSAYMPHWTESGLRPRDSARMDRFVNIAYFGLDARLAPQLRAASFSKLMAERGFRFLIVDSGKWNDYSEVDAVLAVRSFAAVPFYKHPPTKLYNTWMAGVPALLGHESAFLAERKNELDYFEVGSVAQILETLEHLRDNPELRAAVAKNCAERALEVTPEAIVERWIAFCDNTAVSAYTTWLAKRPSQINHFLFRRKIAYTWFRFSDFAYRSVVMLRKQVMRFIG